MVQWSVVGDSRKAALDAQLQSNDCTTLNQRSSFLGLNKLYTAWSLTYTEFYMYVLDIFGVLPAACDCYFDARCIILGIIDLLTYDFI